ncbi:MAG: hypothetical protein IT538_08940 [Variibacter sp.]|nr:hypothetical protein [Variibacter sp.]
MRAIRWFIIRIAEIFILLVMLGFILASGAAGYQSIVYLRNDAGMELPFGPGVGFAIGAVVGFIVASVTCAVFFLLVEIANNTRRTVTFFDHIVNRSNGGYEGQ